MDFQLLISTLGPIGAAIVTIWAVKDKASQAFVEILSKRLSSVETRLEKCEEDRLGLHKELLSLMKGKT